MAAKLCVSFFCLHFFQCCGGSLPTQPWLMKHATQFRLPLQLYIPNLTFGERKSSYFTIWRIRSFNHQLKCAKVPSCMFSSFTQLDISEKGRRRNVFEGGALLLCCVIALSSFAMGFGNLIAVVLWIFIAPPWTLNAIAIVREVEDNLCNHFVWTQLLWLRDGPLH